MHWHVLEARLRLDLPFGQYALIHVYAKSGSVDDEQVVFDRKEDHNVITWSAMIGGRAQHGRGLEGLRVGNVLVHMYAKSGKILMMRDQLLAR